MYIHAYHGSKHEFNSFKNQKSFFFAEQKPAEFFGKIIYHCELSIKKSLLIDANGQSQNSIFLEEEPFWDNLINFCIKGSGGDPENEEDEKTQYFSRYGATINHISKWAEEHGYDSVIALNIHDDNANYDGTQIIVFKPEQISILDTKKLEESKE